MPKLNPIAIALASIAFFAIGAVWYAVLFADAWMAAMGIEKAAEDANGAAWMGVGAVITVMQVLGLAIVFKWKGVAGLADGAKTAALLWALFALPFTLYGYIYSPGHNATLLAIDAGHLFVGWVTAGAILGLFK